MTSPTYKLTKFKDKVIAIDGPAGSGKSTTAKILAARLGYKYLDTGAMYRAITYVALSKGVVDDENEVIKIAEEIELKLSFENGLTRVFADHEEITDNIRTPEVNSNVSNISTIPEVREQMVILQRQLAKDRNLIAEGRDTTTVVFPDASVKVYLTASVEERAKRRHKELLEKGVDISLEDVRDNIEERDKIDSGRKVSPLTIAEDAVEIDSTDMAIPEEIDKILHLIEEAAGYKLR